MMEKIPALKLVIPNRMKLFYYLTQSIKPNPRWRNVLAGLLIWSWAISAQAGWTVLDSNTTENLFAVDFPENAVVGYVVGDHGTVLKTTDGGMNWSKQKTRIRVRLSDVDFVNNQIGYAVGIDGTVLKTVDGGARWQQLNAGTNQHLNTVHFVDESVGYIGGLYGTLLKTTDGGATWAPLFIPEGSVYDIAFPNNGPTGYVATLYGSLGYVYKTVDGGQNWSQVLFLEDAYIYSINFPMDDQIGYVTNSDTYLKPGIWKTTDGGATWSFISQGVTSVPAAIDFPLDNNIGFAVGQAGALMTTSNGGIDWVEGNIGVMTQLKDVQFVNHSTGYTVGFSGVIAKTEDGGTPAELTVYLHPTGAGSINTFTERVGCSVDWDCVNDQAANLGIGAPVEPITQDYIGDAGGNRAMFALDNGVVSDNQSISQICVAIAATQWNGPYASLSYQRIGIDPAPVDSAAFWLGNYWYNGIRSYCWNNLNWTGTDLDALEIGVKGVNGQLIQAAQLYVKVYYRP